MVIPKIIFGIDGKEISHFTKIDLKQTINTHHEFSISIPHSVIERHRSYTMENAQEWLTKVLHIKLSPSNSFLGIITNISYKQELGHTGSQIVISGYSKTILLESGEKLHSWENFNLKDMVHDVIQIAAGEELQHEINPEFTSKVEYQTQYLESDFRYIQRLAKQYNEWLFYDGEKLFFGKPKTEKTSIQLIYNKDLYNLNIAVQAKPNQYSGYTYNENNDQLYQAHTDDTIARGLPKLGKDAFEASRKLYETPSYQYGEFSIGDDIYFESILKRKQQSTAADGNYITATSRNPKLGIGSVINIRSQQILDKSDVIKKELDVTKTHYDFNEIGTYIITEIHHKATDIGEYENSFKALPAKIKKLPEPDVTMPVAQEQRAVVLANDDPNGNGRIRVQLLWQKKEQSRTPWLYVLTPNAGTSDVVEKNRGWVTIPEVGDHVMIGFRYNDPNRPYVLGSIFNGKTAEGGKLDNHIKSFFTRCGSTITFDDTQKSILIKDPSDNSIYMDGEGNITVNAPKNMTINVGDNLDITVGKNMTAAVGGNKKTTIDGNNSLTVRKNNTIEITELHKLITHMYEEKVAADKTVKINGDLNKVTATTTHKAIGGDILIKSSGISKVLGAIDAKVNKG
ncbi:Vgr family protein [Flavobacterium sp. WLB]|uniref:type VI secretion system Vgr family protein n=1 Tax=unclassified Flavobacterium TaxID=196869 RepID=UPI0006ABCDC6|nr:MULTISPECIES: phage baseplate assembly protein V [unclassified Flavobacterium]KOP39809.1 Vgr family protein [Flavobacterium sp. VMW]OWU92597.1 Vgr family protein [Flavobacterium sp. NLM]PUU67849.1 Vgr family protein [Flavobacterium sp. WLB]